MLLLILMMLLLLLLLLQTYLKPFFIGEKSGRSKSSEFCDDAGNRGFNLISDACDLFLKSFCCKDDDEDDADAAVLDYSRRDCCCNFFAASSSVMTYMKRCRLEIAVLYTYRYTVYYMLLAKPFIEDYEDEAVVRGNIDYYVNVPFSGFNRLERDLFGERVGEG